jgi:hypothetical protein
LDQNHQQHQWIGENSNVTANDKEEEEDVILDVAPADEVDEDEVEENKLVGLNCHL